jgi:GT2 family glycosyltransferase
VSAAKVVILTYGTSGVHVPLLDQLLADGVAPQDVVLAHNPSAPGDPWEPESRPGVRVLVQPANLGYAGGMNAGIRAHADGDALLLLTHDARLAPGAVQALGGALDAHTRVGIVGPLLEVASTGAIWSFGVRRSGGLLRHVTQAARGADAFAPTDAIDGTVMLVRRAALDATGGFDERFFMYFEESDLCLRAGRAGWQVGVSFDATAVTEPGSVKRHGAHAYFFARNGLEFARRAAGLRGVLQFAGRLALQTYVSLPRPWAGAVPDGQPRVFRDRLHGTARGVLDFTLRRWGPPPASIRRLSDISGTA